LPSYGRRVASSARNASSASDGDTRLLTRQRDADQLADAIQEIHPLAGMEVRGIAAADHEEAEAHVPSERQHRGRRDRVRVAIEQDRLLAVTQRTAARAGALNEGREGFEVRVVARHYLHEAGCVRLQPGVREEHERRPLRAEILAQARLDLLDAVRRAVRPHEPE